MSVTSGLDCGAMSQTIGRAADSNARFVVDEILDPAPAAIRLVDAREKGRNDLPQLGEHHLGVRLNFFERMREHPQQQCLEGLTGSE